MADNDNNLKINQRKTDPEFPESWLVPKQKFVNAVSHNRDFTLAP